MQRHAQKSAPIETTIALNAPDTRRDGVSRSEPCGVSRQDHEKRRGARPFAAV
jgi:hypothetical protein